LSGRKKIALVYNEGNRLAELKTPLKVTVNGIART
jgi:hypothetical protein